MKKMNLMGSDGPLQLEIPLSFLSNLPKTFKGTKPYNTIPAKSCKCISSKVRSTPPSFLASQDRLKAQKWPATVTSMGMDVQNHQGSKIPDLKRNVKSSFIKGELHIEAAGCFAKQRPLHAFGAQMLHANLRANTDEELPLQQFISNAVL